jgi:hypothetical protein
MFESSITEIVVYLGLIAAVAERITASIKAVVDLNKLQNEKVRVAVLQGITFATSALAAVLNPPDTIIFLKDLPFLQSILIVGLLGSAGSNVWHDALSTLTAFKDKHKADAVMMKADAKDAQSGN